MKVVLSCEHAVNNIPKVYQKFFINAQDILQTHRGYDLGALELFNTIKNNKVYYSQCATASRLLVDINRSLYRRTLFSEFTKPLSKDDRRRILDDYYYSFRLPFWEKVNDLWTQNVFVLHLSVHSFTPRLNGRERETDFGILYHPGRPQEKLFAQLWKAELRKALPDFRVRFNYPYQGKPDGHVRYFRDREEKLYAGIEFEMNQKYAGDAVINAGIAEAFWRAYKEYKNNLG